MVHDAKTPRINDLEAVAGGPLLATSIVDGASKLNQIVEKGDATLYTTDQTNLLITSNVPAGTYRAPKSH